MKKFSAFIIGLFTLAAVAQAQTQPTQKRLSWGFKLGMNVSNIRVENGTASDWKSGLATGISVNIKAGNNFSIQLEALYSSMGGRNLQGNETSLRLNYFSLPILAKYRFTNRFSVFAGPQFDVMILAKTKNNDGFDEVTNDFKENSFNATGGIEVWPAKCLGFSARYIYGFNNILETDVMKWKNQGVQLAATIKL